jgi:hypothetical protein
VSPGVPPFPCAVMQPVPLVLDACTAGNERASQTRFWELWRPPAGASFGCAACSDVCCAAGTIRTSNMRGTWATGAVPCCPCWC